MKYIMNGFNLNSDSYQVHELEDLFGLKSPYSEQDISKAKGILSEQLTSSGDLGPEKKREILFFIDTIAERISNRPRRIPHPPRRDNAPHQKPHDNQHTNETGTWSEDPVPVGQYGSNIIIDNPNEIVGRHARITEGRLANENRAPPGYINPINIRTTMQAVNIDSRFRPHYYKTSSTKYSIKLPSTQKRVTKMTVGSLEIPLTYHAISENLGNNRCLIIDSSNNTADWSCLDALGAPANNGNHCIAGPYATGGPLDAWLLVLPDGNYEPSWAAKSEATDIEVAMNNAISTAIPGKIDINTGKFGAGGANLNLKPTQDICFRLDRTSGRSTFATPAQDASSGIFHNGFTIRFTVSSVGNLDLDTSIQFKLGWPLGFRAGEYIGGGGAIAGRTPTIGVPRRLAAATVSEGICFISGPRYGFLSIDDHQKNSGNSYIVAYANSVFDRNIISRINLAAVMDEAGTYKSSNDPGLTTAMNRSREYFGPVDIQQLTITLFDEYGRVIDLNNMDWSFTLAFEKLYD